jgi:hypothetical protein
MAHMEQKHVLKMKINYKFFFFEHPLGSGEVRISLIEFGLSKYLMSTGVYHRG